MRLFSVLPIKFYCVERQKILLFFISTVHDFELLAQFVAAQCRCIAGWWLHCCVAGAAVPTQYRSRWHCRQKGRGVCQSEREHRHHHPTRPLHADRFGALAELERENILERTEKMIFHQTFHDWTKKKEKDFSLSSQLVKKASQSLAA